LAGQAIRPSQFITTYGPGSILEGPDGPRVICSLANSGIFGHKQPSELEIVDQRLSDSLLEGSGILRLPTNAELGVIDSAAIYETKPFPSWSLCVKHNLMYSLHYGDVVGCPDCKALPNKFEAWKKARREAMRFVMACPKGHMDDVDWVRLIKHNKSSCNPRHLIWRGGGGALKNVDIVCPKCRGEFNLGQAYARDLKCSGKHPELGTERPGCDEDAKMMQRGAANLRLPELVTSLTIPKRDTSLHQLLGQASIRLLLLGTGAKDKTSLVKLLQPLVDRGAIPIKLVQDIQKYSDSVVAETIEDVCEAISAKNPYEYRLEEFEALQIAARRGAPLMPAATPGAPPLFEVIRQDVRQITGPNGGRLRITPVSRLRVVMVQKGYKRLDPANDFVVPTSYSDEIRHWYVGTETFGEGIFIDLGPDESGHDLDHFPLEGDESNTWMNAFSNPAEFGLDNGLYQREQYHPIFVWWHTLAHRLINALSVDSGYSSASIRERVFVDFDERDPSRSRGGILLYTTQPGGDGTLGGLIALVPEFDRVLRSALRNVDTCSNDPLCGEENFAPGRLNGAACYACQFVSETSCEYRNMLIDRNLLLRNLP